MKVDFFLFSFAVCSEHFYGLDCSTPCGHCLNKDVCDNVTGRCPNGCQNYWTGDGCDGGYLVNIVLYKLSGEKMYL